MKDRDSTAQLVKPQKNSYVKKLTLKCCFGSYGSSKVDSSQQTPAMLTQTDRASNARLSKAARKDSCTLGCQYEMTILQFASWPWVTRIRICCMDHVSADGTPLHGSAAAVAAADGNISRNQTLHLSQHIRNVIQDATSRVLTVPQIYRDLKERTQNKGRVLWQGCRHHRSGCQKHCKGCCTAAVASERPSPSRMRAIRNPLLCSTFCDFHRLPTPLSCFAARSHSVSLGGSFGFILL